MTKKFRGWTGGGKDLHGKLKSRWGESRTARQS